MYSVGSIEPEGMLNGAPTNDRNAQANTATMSTNRASEPAVSFFSLFRGPAVERLRRGVIGQAGLANGDPRIMCGGDAAISDQAARRAVRRRAGPAEQAHLRSR